MAWMLKSPFSWWSKTKQSSCLLLKFLLNHLKSAFLLVKSCWIPFLPTKSSHFPSPSASASKGSAGGWRPSAPQPPSLRRRLSRSPSEWGTVRPLGSALWQSPKLQVSSQKWHNSHIANEVAAGFWSCISDASGWLDITEWKAWMLNRWFNNEISYLSCGSSWPQHRKKLNRCSPIHQLLASHIPMFSHLFHIPMDNTTISLGESPKVPEWMECLQEHHMMFFPSEHFFFE